MTSSPVSSKSTGNQMVVAVAFAFRMDAPPRTFSTSVVCKVELIFSGLSCRLLWLLTTGSWFFYYCAMCIFFRFGFFFQFFCKGCCQEINDVQENTQYNQNHSTNLDLLERCGHLLSRSVQVLKFLLGFCLSAVLFALGVIAGLSSLPETIQKINCSIHKNFKQKGFFFFPLKMEYLVKQPLVFREPNLRA